MIHSLSTILLVVVVNSLPPFFNPIRPGSGQEAHIPELIARHLDSIGTAEARSKASTRVAGGETKFIARSADRPT